MMDYEVFKNIVKENFLKYMPQEYKDAAVDIRPAPKVNRTLDALTLFQGGNSQVFPTVYVNDMYGQYLACGNLEDVLRGTAERYAGALGELKGYKMELDMEHLRENVVLCLVNTEQNREMLADMPSREFHDLSVIYRWVVETTPDAVCSVIVKNGLAEAAGMSEEELFRCAVENTRRIFPVSVKSMSDIVGHIPEGIEIPQEIREEMEEAQHVAENMWVISNSRGINGAASVLYEENLHQLAEKLGENLFILPSSIHEVIAFPAGMAEKNLTHMLEMVHEVNMGSLKLEERLSNNVYCYDRNARTVTLAAESPEKRLDGKEAGMPLIQEEERKR